MKRWGTLLLVSVLLCVSGCHPTSSAEYDRQAFGCTLVWDGYTADCTMEKGSFTMEICEPAVLKGLRFIFGPEGCTMVCEEVKIPLSQKAARRLSVYAELLTADPALGRRDGNMLCFEAGAVELGEDGTPVRVEPSGTAAAEVRNFADYPPETAGNAQDFS